MTDNITPSLLPCPFCGSADVATETYGVEWSVRCHNCFSVFICRAGGWQSLDKELESVVVAWNRRASGGAE